MSWNKIAALRMKMKEIKMPIIIKKIFSTKRIFISTDRYSTFTLGNMKKPFRI
jgi:hypothetical protein